jgi:DNA mismatch repair protein MutS
LADGFYRIDLVEVVMAVDTAFCSVLVDRSNPDDPIRPDRPGQPDFFVDLNLDQVVSAVTNGREEYDLASLFATPLRNIEAVRYRHEVVRDLQRPEVREPVDDFAERMRRVRAHLAQADAVRHPLQKQRWFLDATSVYCAAVTTLTDRLHHVDLGSRGLQSLRDHLAAYVGSAPFRDLASVARRLRKQLAAVRYCVQIRSPQVLVRACEGEADQGAVTERIFARFQQGAVKDYRVTFPEYADMNHVEAQVLDRVAMLYPDLFRDLAAFRTAYDRFRDATIDRFDRDVQFYLGYLDLAHRLSGSGLSFCLPEVSDDPGEVVIDDGFDLALAAALVPEGTPVVANGVRLRYPERVVVVTGPNQGGKTTFARMFGQVPYLASLGLPVPARHAVLGLADRVFTVFEREEDLATLHGKLDDELVRIHDTLNRATRCSVIVMNESFASTTLRDACFIGTEVLRRIIALGSTTVYVTFVDEFASLDDAVVSMVGGIAGDSRQRTYRIRRQPADGLAYAAVLAEAYGLTEESLRRRIAG